MVGRLIENQQVYRLQQQTDHRQATSLSTTEHFHFLVRLLATKHEGAKDIVDTQTDLALRYVVDGLENGEVLVEQLCLILGKIANLDVVAHFQFACIWNLAHNTLHER